MTVKRMHTLQHVEAVMKKHGWNRVKAAHELKLSRSGLIDYLNRLRQAGIKVVASPDSYLRTRVMAGSGADAKVLHSRLREVERENRRLTELSLTDKKVMQQLGVLDERAHAVKPPDWLMDMKGSNKIVGVPTLFASDWHLGEVVRAAEIGGVNSYNLAIAKARAKKLIETATRLLKFYIRDAEYPGIVFALGGDMVSGDIHEELAQTNEIESIPTVLEAVSILTWCIDQLVEEFGRVFVPCVTGNHGRTSHKPRAKRRNHTNYDWLIYQLLLRHYAKDARVSFLIPEGSDAYYRVYSHRYLLTHGDQLRGGDGMIGMLGPVLRGDLRKRTRQTQVNQSYDTMIMGHWHQLTQLPRVIVNGSLKGYDEYAAQGNFTFEQPAQALWITHPDHGITFSMPVYVDRVKGREKTTWIGLPSGE